MSAANRASMIRLLVGSFSLPAAAAEGTYEALVKPGSGLAPDAAFHSRGFETVLAIRAEMEGMWGGTPPAAGKYLDLSHYSRAIAMASE